MELTTETTGITAWIATNGQNVYFFAQIAYWALMAFFAGWAACSLYRWVNFITGRAAAKAAAKAGVAMPVAADAAKIDVEAFVE